MHRLPTGCQSLDSILSGGFPFGAISLVYGAAATGKTTLALNCAITHLSSNPQGKVFYVDSDQKLSSKRLIQMASGSQSILKHLLIWRPGSFSEQMVITERISMLETGENPIIIDSITGLYRLEASAEKNFTANKMLNRQLGFLSETAQTKESAVLLIGQVYSQIQSEPSQLEPVAQRLLRYWSNTVIRLEPTPTPGIKQAVLEKPPQASKTCKFSLSDKGLTEVEDRW